MIRKFCDKCGEVLALEGDKRLRRNVVTTRLEGKRGGIGFEVIVYQNGAANKGEYCGYCVLDAINSIDDRPGVARA